MIIEDTPQNREWLQSTMKCCFGYEPNEQDLRDIFDHPFNKHMDPVFCGTTMRRKWLLFKIYTDMSSWGRFK